MRGRFYRTEQRPLATNVSRPVRSGPKLTKEARAALNERRQEASLRYRAALDEAWSNLDETLAKIASDHNKSLRRVESDLRLGRPVSLQRHSRKNAWNAFCWKKCKEDKENEDENGM